MAISSSCAIKLLRKRGAKHLIHCGDVCATRVLDLMAGITAAFVWGNCDYDRRTLQGHAAAMGIACCGSMGRLTLDGKVVSFLHGDDHRQVQRILDAQDCDYLLLGHSHVRYDQRVGRIHVINPGALHRASVKTVALADTATDVVEFLEINDT